MLLVELTLVSSHAVCSRYLDEQSFRYNNRATKDNPLNDADRFDIAVRQVVGKRITFAEMTGKPN